MSPAEQVSAKQHQRAYWAWIAVCVCWGTTFLAIRITLESLPPLAMAGSRHVIAGIIVAIAVTARGIDLPQRESWPMHALLGVLMIGLGNGGVVWAEQFVPSGLAAVMVSVIPFWMVGVEALMPGSERLHLSQFIGLLLGFGGIVLLTSSNVTVGGAAGGRFLQGVIALQCSCCGWAIGSAYAKRHARHENVFAATAMQMIFGGLSLMLAGTLLGEWHSVQMTFRSGLAFVYLIIFGSLVGYASYAYALKYLPITTVSLYAYVNPVIAVMLGALLLKEPYTARMVVAIGIIFVAMLIVRRSADTSSSSRAPA